MVREYVTETKQIKTQIEKMFENAVYENKLVVAHFSVGQPGKEEYAINSHMTCNPLNIEVNDNIISLGDTDDHCIDMSQFEYIRCDDECVDDIADETIDMESSTGYSVHFDFMAI